MRPYVVEILMTLAAGICIGGHLSDKKWRKKLETMKDPIKEEAEKDGVGVNYENGKITLDFSNIKR